MEHLFPFHFTGTTQGQLFKALFQITLINALQLFVYAAAILLAVRLVLS